MMERLGKTRHGLPQIFYIYYKNTVRKGSADLGVIIGLLGKKNRLFKNGLSL